LLTGGECIDGCGLGDHVLAGGKACMFRRARSALDVSLNETAPSAVLCGGANVPIGTLKTEMEKGSM
jgi:hypothetical protein